MLFYYHSNVQVSQRLICGRCGSQHLNEQMFRSPDKCCLPDFFFFFFKLLFDILVCSVFRCYKFRALEDGVLSVFINKQHW